MSWSPAASTEQKIRSSAKGTWNGNQKLALMQLSNSFTRSEISVGLRSSVWLLLYLKKCSCGGMRIILLGYSMRLLFSTKCNTNMREICTISWKSAIRYLLLLAEEEYFLNVRDYRCKWVGDNLPYWAAFTVNHIRWKQWWIVWEFAERVCQQISTVSIWWSYFQWRNLRLWHCWNPTTNRFLTIKCFMRTYS